jgi:DNA transformation protein
MTASREFADFVIGQMAALGPVQARRMFGGFGLYRQGLMFALIVDDRLYFKTDEHNRQAFLGRGLGPFTYAARGREVRVDYHEAPAEVFDDPAAMAEWAAGAHACARRAARLPRRPA